MMQDSCIEDAVRTAAMIIVSLPVKVKLTFSWMDDEECAVVTIESPCSYFADVCVAPRMDKRTRISYENH